MNIKALIAFVVLIAIGIFGYSYYSSKKHEEQLAVMKAESAKVQAETARLGAQEEEAKKEAILSQMPESAKQVLIEREKEQNSNITANGANLDVEIKSANAEQAIELKKIYSKWKDGSELASRSARISLSAPVKNLQDVKREAQSLKVTDCLAPFQANLVGGMDETIKGYYDFMQYDGDMGNTLAYAAHEKAKPMFERFEKGIDTCK